MSKNKSIELMKQRREKEKAKQRDTQGTEGQSAATVAKTLRKPSSELNAQINVRVTHEFRSKLNAWCALNGTTVQELVPTLLEEHLRENPLT